MEMPILSGQCRCELTPTQAEVLRQIFESVLKTGKVPTLQEMAASLKRSDKEISATMDRLEEKDLLLRGKGSREITSIYPLSLTPTEHQLFLENGERRFAMCALDALGMPVMFDINVKVVSRCEGCKEPLVIEIKEGEITSRPHPDMMIWSFKERKPRPAETCCPMIKFFCSGEHLEQWETQNPDLVKAGGGVGLQQAFPAIKQRWKQYGELVGIR